MDLLRRLLGARDDGGDLGPVVRYVPAARAPDPPRAAAPRPADPRKETARHARPRPARPPEPSDPSGELFVDDASSEDLVEQELVAALDEPPAAPGPEAPPSRRPTPEPDARQVVTRRLRRGLDAETRTLSVRALARGGLERVRVIDGATIERLVTGALDEALRRRQERLSKDERAALEADVRRDLVRLSAENARLVDRRGELEARLAELEAELGRERTALDLERARVPAVTIGDGAFAELERRVRGLVLRLARDGELPGGLEPELAATVRRVVEAERERHLGAERGARDEEVARLEARVQKLQAALGDTEAHLAALAAAASADPGAPSVYDVVQGLDPDRPGAGRKGELLREVFQQNVAIWDAADLRSRLPRPEAPALQAPAAPPARATPAAAPLDAPLDPGASVPTPATDDVAF